MATDDERIADIRCWAIYTTPPPIRSPRDLPQVRGPQIDRVMKLIPKPQHLRSWAWRVAGGDPVEARRLIHHVPLSDVWEQWGHMILYGRLKEI